MIGINSMIQELRISMLMRQEIKLLVVDSNTMTGEVQEVQEVKMLICWCIRRRSRVIGSLKSK